MQITAIDIQLVTGMSRDIKRQAFELFQEGLGFPSIGRFLKCSHVAVYYWIKAYGESVEAIRSKARVEIVEMDDMHTYYWPKKTIAASGLLLISAWTIVSLVRCRHPQHGSRVGITGSSMIRPIGIAILRN